MMRLGMLYNSRRPVRFMSYYYYYYYFLCTFI